MTWKFDQAPNVACIASQAVLEGAPVLVATHYDDDHSWAFLDGQSFDPADARVVAMSEALVLHPDLDDIAGLPPGWSATRAAVGEPWSKAQDEWAPEV